MFEWMMRFDKNGDGKLSKNELPEHIAERMLERFDANKDGAIQRNELQAARGMGMRDPGAPDKDVDAELATHVELKPLPVKFGELKSLRLAADGNLFTVDAKKGVIQVISPQGRVVRTIDPGFGAEVIDLAPNGELFCGGHGFLAAIGTKGKVLRKVKLPEYKDTQAGPRRRGGSHPPGISGLAVSEKFVFVTCGSGWSVSAKAGLYRYTRDLKKPKLLAKDLRGCCQHCDIAYRDGTLFLAENSAFRVVLYNDKGKVLKKWGSKSRHDVKLFGGCCNPMNIAFDAKGVLYTAESGLGRVKRYSPDGRFLGLVGYLDVERFTRGGRLASSCCHIPIAVTPHGKRVYVTDVKENIIRVLQRKPS
jgi:hypothetical protein